MSVISKKNNSVLYQGIKSDSLRIIIVGLLFLLLMSVLAVVGFSTISVYTILYVLIGLIMLIIGFFGFKQAVENPLIPYFIIFNMNILVFFIPKADYLAAGIGLITSIVFIIRNFKAASKNITVASFLMFFLINAFYWFFYSTDFIVGKIILHNGNVFIKESNNEFAKNIVFYANLCPLISNCVVINAFKTNKESLVMLLKKYYPYCSVIFSLLALLSNVLPVKLDIAGQTLILPMVFVFNVFYWFCIADKNNKTLNMLFGLAQVALLISIFLKANKTTLLGVIFIMTLFIMGLKNIYTHIGVSKKIRQIVSNPTLVVMIILTAFVAVIIAYMLGFFDLASSKIDYFVNGLSKKSTLDVRTSNWSYFFDSWQDKLNIVNLIFGFGEAASREAIFFISASRHSFPNNNYLVQTLHNAYLEYAYDFGLMALFYYFPTWVLLKRHTTVFISSQNMLLRTISLSLLLTVIFLSFYAFLDGIRIQVAIFYYLLLFTYDGIYTYFSSSKNLISSHVNNG